MAQPPLSQQIRQLEARLDTRLFTRTTRSVEPSPGLCPVVGAVYRELDGGAHTIDLAMAWRRDDHSPALAAGLNVVRRAIREARRRPGSA